MTIKLHVLNILSLIVFMSPFPCYADLLSDLCRQGIVDMSQSHELGDVAAIHVTIVDPALKEAFDIAIGELDKPYKQSENSPVKINAFVKETREYFWERPYHYLVLHIMAEKKGHIVWQHTVRSTKEVIASSLALPVRVFLIIVLWPLIVQWCFRFCDYSYERRKYFKVVWGILSVCISWTYIGPTYF